MKGHKKQCLAAGMEDYLTKPVTMDGVRAMVEKWTSSSTATEGSTAQGNASPGGDSHMDLQPIDIEKALDQLGGDRELFDDVVRAFFGTIPELLDELRAACDHSDGGRLGAAAHSLKGAAANICAEPARQSAVRLEKMGNDAEFGEADAVLVGLESELERLRGVVERIVSDGHRNRQYPLRTPRVKIQRQWLARLPINRWKPLDCIIR